VKEATMKKDKNGKPKKIPLKGVIIETNEQARATSSDSGTFKLNISKAPFKITKAEIKDYTLLTPEAGKTTYHDGKDIIDILLVSDKTFNNYMDSQMKVATKEREKKKNQALEEIKQQKDEGKIKYGEYLQKQDSINEAYNEQMKRLAEFVERSSKEFFKGMEQIDKEIDDCIMKGDYLKADSLLISKGYFNERIKNIEKLKQVTDQYVEDAVSDCWKYAEINRDKVNYTNALAYLDTARVLQEKYLEHLHPDLARTYNDIGLIYSDQQCLKESLNWFYKTLAIIEKSSDSFNDDLAILYNDIGFIYWREDKLDTALYYYNKALDIRKQLLDTVSLNIATIYNNIGNVYSAQEELSNALDMQYRALEIREKLCDSLSPDLAISYNDVGAVYFNMGELAKSFFWIHKTMMIREKVLHPLHPYLALTYSNISVLYSAMDRFEEAFKFIDKALEIQEQVLDPLSPDLATSYNNKGSVYWNQGKYEEALKWYDKALEIQEKVLDPLSPDLAITYHIIGLAYVGMKNYEEALEYFEKALPGFIKSYGEENEITILLKQLIEYCKQALGK
jgi:tetratricopeptide (TPR) repeat protein